jgi:leucyl-tRNA synthetase
VVGVYGFLRRVWRMVVDWEADDDRCSPAVSEVEPTAEQNRVLHKTILAVTADIENMSFNTAIARMMEFVNFFGREKVRPKKAIEDFILLLAPFAPHIAEELWQRLGHDESLIRVPWPVGDESYVAESTVTIPVQVNGKLRAKIKLPIDTDHQAAEAVAKADPKIAAALEGKTVVKTIIIPHKMVNFVVR